MSVGIPFKTTLRERSSGSEKVWNSVDCFNKVFWIRRNWVASATRKVTRSPEDFADKELGCRLGKAYMMGATLRQETELSMKGGGLEIC